LLILIEIDDTKSGRFHHGWRGVARMGALADFIPDTCCENQVTRYNSRSPLPLRPQSVKRAPNPARGQGQFLLFGD